MKAEFIGYEREYYKDRAVAKPVFTLSGHKKVLEGDIVTIDFLVDHAIPLPEYPTYEQWLSKMWPR